METKVKQNSVHSFNTLETRQDFFKSISHETQYYKALRKKKNNEKIFSIIDFLKQKKRPTFEGRTDVETYYFELNKQVKKYYKTYHCQNILIQKGNNITGSLCRQRWCSICSRIRTAELTNAYKEPILNLGDLYFVTLTRPNVKGAKLKGEVKKLKKVFTLILNNLQKNYKIKLAGLRKLEVTYNKLLDTYHPHFHMILSNEKHAYELQRLWLKQFPTANYKAQDIRKINTTNDKSFIELFKYATKDATKDGEAYSGEVLHTIYDALSGGKIYQKYGTFKKLVLEPTGEKNETSNCDWLEPNDEIFAYSMNSIDWLCSKIVSLVNTLEIQNRINLEKLIKIKPTEKTRLKIPISINSN